MRAADRPKILFLGANPAESTRGAVAREFREIERRLQATPQGRALHLVSAWAVRASDLQAHLLEYTPAVVHLSGQGSGAGQLLLEDEHGAAAPVDPEALAKRFGILGEGIRVSS